MTELLCLAHLWAMLKGRVTIVRDLASRAPAQAELRVSTVEKMTPHEVEP